MAIVQESFTLTEAQARYYIALQEAQHLTYQELYALEPWPVLLGKWEKTLRAWRRRFGLPKVRRNTRPQGTATRTGRSQEAPELDEGYSHGTDIGRGMSRVLLHRQPRCHYCNHPYAKELCCFACRRTLRRLIAAGKALYLCTCASCAALPAYVQTLVTPDEWQAYQASRSTQEQDGEWTQGGTSLAMFDEVTNYDRDWAEVEAYEEAG